MIDSIIETKMDDGAGGGAGGGGLGVWDHAAAPPGLYLRNGGRSWGRKR